MQGTLQLTHAVVWHGVAWHGVARHGVAWHGTAWHPRRGTVWHGVACGLVWSVAVRCDATLCRARAHGAHYFPFGGFGVDIFLDRLQPPLPSQPRLQCLCMDMCIDECIDMYTANAE